MCIRTAIICGQGTEIAARRRCLYDPFLDNTGSVCPTTGYRVFNEEESIESCNDCMDHTTTQNYWHQPRAETVAQGFWGQQHTSVDAMEVCELRGNGCNCCEAIEHNLLYVPELVSDHSSIEDSCNDNFDDFDDMDAIGGNSNVGRITSTPHSPVQQVCHPSSTEHSGCSLRVRPPDRPDQRKRKQPPARNAELERRNIRGTKSSTSRSQIRSARKEQGRDNDQANRSNGSKSCRDLVRETVGYRKSASHARNTPYLASAHPQKQGKPTRGDNDRRNGAQRHQVDGVLDVQERGRGSPNRNCRTKR